MISTQRFYRKRSFWLFVIVFVFFAAFLYLFQNEVCAFIYNKPCGAESAQVPGRATGFRVILQFSILFLFSLGISLFIVSQFVLPVQTPSERMKVFSRFLLYFLNRHGPAIFVHEGVQKVRTEEMQSSRPGVAFVDSCSAIVLEKQWKPRRPQPKDRSLTRFFNQHNSPPGKISIPDPLVRAVGPGIVYTRNNERVIGVTDLRKQFRMNSQVLAYTADGLEIKANVWAIFCLGLPEEVLKIAYIEEGDGLDNSKRNALPKDKRDKLDQEMCKKLRVLKINRKWDNERNHSVEYIEDIQDDLDSEDRSPGRDKIIIDRGEVHRYALTKTEMNQFLGPLSRLSESILRRWVISLNPPGSSVILDFIATLYVNNREILFQIFNQLMPIDLPEAGIYRFAFNKTILHQIIDDFENYLPKDQQATNPLSAADKRILHRFTDQLFRRYRQTLVQFYEDIDQETHASLKAIIDAFGQKYWMNKEHPRQQEAEQYPPVVSPFVFDAKRVFHAIYARGRNPENNIPIRSDDWMKQPTQIATELFRQELSLVKYDDLYMPQVPNRYPLANEVKPRFGRIMQNSGVLAYQLIRRKDGGKIEKGQVLDSQTFNMDYPVMKFRQPKPLRERGIRVVAAGFTELTPETIEKDELQGKTSTAAVTEDNAGQHYPAPGSPAELPSGAPSTPWTSAPEQPRSNMPLVRRQRFDTWQAQWQKESELIRAESELELMHIRSRARAQAQQDMTRVLSQILESTNSKEAMAMQLLQALEAAATDPSTHKLMPHDTLEMLQSLRQWLLIGGYESGKPVSGSSTTNQDKPGGQG